MSTRAAILSLAMLVAMGSCKSARPTEFVNIVFTVSYDTRDYRTWDFDLEASQDFPVDWAPHARLRALLLADIEEILGDLGYERVPGGEVDFRVSYEFWVEPETSRDETVAPARGSIVVRDGKNGAFIWRATRKAPVRPHGDGSGMEAGVRAFAEEMLFYISKLETKLEE